MTDPLGRQRLEDPEDFVHLEVNTGLERGIMIIPVLVDDATMPNAQDLPEALTKLAGLNALEISNTNWASDVDELIAVVEKHLKIAGRQWRPLQIELSDRTLYKTDSFDVRFASAQRLDLYGYSLIGLVTSYLGFLRDKSQAGCKMRIILLDPTSLAVQVVSEITEAKTYLRQNIEQSARELKKMRNVKLKYTSIPAPYSLVIRDSEKAHGSVEVELYSYGVESRYWPRFALTKAKSDHWYSFFVQQFEKLWKSASKRRGQQRRGQRGRRGQGRRVE